MLGVKGTEREQGKENIVEERGGNDTSTRWQHIFLWVLGVLGAF